MIVLYVYRKIQYILLAYIGFCVTQAHLQEISNFLPVGLITHSDLCFGDITFSTLGDQWFETASKFL